MYCSWDAVAPRALGLNLWRNQSVDRSICVALCYWLMWPVPNVAAIFVFFYPVDVACYGARVKNLDATRDACPWKNAQRTWCSWAHGAATCLPRSKTLSYAMKSTLTSCWVAHIYPAAAVIKLSAYVSFLRHSLLIDALLSANDWSVKRIRLIPLTKLPLECRIQSRGDAS